MIFSNTRFDYNSYKIVSLGREQGLQKKIPTCAWITVNRACNFRCNGCYAKSTGYGKNQDLSMKLAEDIVSLVADLGINNITVIGGEPTLWKDLVDFNKLCKEKNIKTTIVTNAMRFGDDVFWQNYLETPNTKAGISIKAFDKRSLKDVAKVDSFKLVKKGIERAIAHFQCGVSTVYTTTMAKSFLDIAKFAMDCGAKGLGVSPCTPGLCNGEADGTFVVEPKNTVRHIVRTYPELNEVTGGKIIFTMKLPLCIWPEEFIETLVERNQIRSVCQLQHRSGIVFDVNGQVILCNSLFDYPIGKYGLDFNDKDSLIQLMNSKETIEAYDRLTSYPSKKCINCSRYEVCAGGCPLYWTLFDPDQIIPGIQTI